MVVEVGAGVGLEAQDGAVVEQPAQELGLRHDLGQVVDAGKTEVRGCGIGRVRQEVDLLEGAGAEDLGVDLAGERRALEGRAP